MSCVVLFYRDFKNTSNDEDSDSDYEPDVKPKIKRIRREKATGTTDNTEHSLGIQSHRRPGKMCNSHSKYIFSVVLPFTVNL